MRCKACRHTADEGLPPVDKKVIYLDQFAFSELFKTKAGVRRKPSPHDGFWQDLHSQIQRVLLLQQAIFPTSDIHHNETTVSPFPKELREAYENLSGDVRLKDTDKVSRRQAWECFTAYKQQRAPMFKNNVDEVIEGRRNEWISDLHIHVNSDYSSFANGIRDAINGTADNFNKVIERWKCNRPSFQEVLREEIESYGNSRVQALRHVLTQVEEAQRSNDMLALLEAGWHPIFRELTELKGALQKEGLSEVEAQVEVIRFWYWPGNWEQPHHRISTYMYAALARKFVAGQRKPPTRGFMNDVRAIAAYAPYVDAMFIDNECAALLNEAPLCDELSFRARLFSLNKAEEFLAYLRDIEDRASDEVRYYAKRIYNLN